MSYEGSLLHLKNWPKNKFYSLFQTAKNQKENFQFDQCKNKIGMLVFLEPSTRTRTSFEVACHRAGIKPVVFVADGSTSLVKGETPLDTLENLSAMKPDFIVLRAPESFDFISWQSTVAVPVINAGWGSFGHPTQALLDLYTLSEKFEDLDGLRLLIFGDILHSRVASSHIEVAEVLGIELGLCAPDGYLPKNLNSKIKVFSKLSEGLEWGQAAMALRVQKERHLDSSHSELTQFLLDEKLLAKSGQHLWLMHPGPVNYGVEIDRAVARSKKSLILRQVENGVKIRQAIIENLFLQRGNL